MERPIGQVFKYKGNSLKVYESNKNIIPLETCRDCYFNSCHCVNRYSSNSYIGECSCIFRDDQNNIIFKKM